MEAIFWPTMPIFHLRSANQLIPRAPQSSLLLSAFQPVLMDGIDISGAEKCMGVPVAAQPLGQAVTCMAPLGPMDANKW